MWAQPVCSKEAWAQNYHIPLYSPIPPFSSNNLTLLLTAIVLTPYFQYIFCILYFGASLRTEYVSPVTRAQEKDCYLGPAACWLVSDNWSSAVTTDHALARWLVSWGDTHSGWEASQARDLFILFWSAQFLERPLLCGTTAWSFFLLPHDHVTISHLIETIDRLQTRMLMTVTLSVSGDTI